MTSVGSIKAVLLDVDGTLYRQAPVRILMCLEMVWFGLRMRSPARLTSLIREIICFRRSRELLRRVGEPNGSLDELQYIEPAKILGEEAEQLRSTVTEWMLQRPLRHITRARRSGVLEFLQFLETNKIKVGILSDYPSRDKLKALRIDRFFSVTLCSTDSQINAFKPHPSGFLRACEVWKLQPSEVLYVGDRPEIDAIGATAAGMPCVIIGMRRSTANYHAINSFVDLRHGLENLR